MKLTFLGTGTSTGVPSIGCDCDTCVSDDPRDKRLRVSILIEHAGRSILVDTSIDFRQQALRANIRHLDAVLITHCHVDHVFGLDDIRPLNFRYGAMNCGKSDTLKAKYSETVMAALKPDTAGIDRVYRNWAGRTQLVIPLGLCTVLDRERFYSFRRDEITGRMASLIWLE